ncbi:hypothetical protein HQO84_04830 [Rhodococcus fascians]|nr:hypothetical protein [Rhodococcus fascians]MBY3998939.1 hypothetical protein [Rhodococcus fascians]MBY4001099.1 hypothetical protein [Rhodococcus fascians]MBY4007517.1 hypothetical protein [Rhodococcus fascians]MBY4015478.1 hypothetical protein [Rhodococcus fascians]
MTIEADVAGAAGAVSHGGAGAIVVVVVGAAAVVVVGVVAPGVRHGSAGVN